GYREIHAGGPVPTHARPVQPRIPSRARRIRPKIRVPAYLTLRASYARRRKSLGAGDRVSGKGFCLGNPVRENGNEGEGGTKLDPRGGPRDDLRGTISDPILTISDSTASDC